VVVVVVLVVVVAAAVGYEANHKTKSNEILVYYNTVA
jgi:hypothetical protein